MGIDIRADSAIWLVVILGHLGTNEGQFLVVTRPKPERHLVDVDHQLVECDENQAFVRDHWLVFLILAFILLLCNIGVIAKKCWDCFHNQSKYDRSSLKLIDIMAADLAENFLKESGWFFGDEGNTHGPFDDSELMRLLDEGDLCATSKVTLANMPLAALMKDPVDRSLEELKIGIHLKRPIDLERKDSSSRAIGRRSTGLLVLPSLDEPITRRSDDSINSVARLVSASKNPEEMHDTGNRLDEAPSLRAVSTRAPSPEADRAKAVLEVCEEEPPEIAENDNTLVKRKLLLQHRSTGASGSRIKEMAMALKTATSQVFQEATQKVFGTDKKKTNIAKVKKPRAAIHRSNDREKPKPHAKKVEFGTDKEKVLKDIFYAFDLDRTGAICFKHLAHISKKMQKGFTSDQLHATLHEADRDGDGEVNYREFVAFMTKNGLDGNGPLHMIRPEHCRALSLEEMFKKFDEDRLGAICFKNLVQISRRYGKDFTEDEIRNVISEADRNGDGEINFKEFKLFMEKVGVKGTPLHIFTNYIEADEISKALPSKKKKLASTANGMVAPMDDGRSRKRGAKKRQPVEEESAMSDDEYVVAATHHPKHKTKQKHPVEEEHAVSDDEYMRKSFHDSEVDRKYKLKHKELHSPRQLEEPRGTGTWTVGNMNPLVLASKPTSSPRDVSIRKSPRGEKASGGRSRQRDIYEDTNDNEDIGDYRNLDRAPRNEQSLKRSTKPPRENMSGRHRPYDLGANGYESSGDYRSSPKHEQSLEAANAPKILVRPTLIHEAHGSKEAS